MALLAKSRSFIREHRRLVLLPIVIAALIVVGLFILNPPKATPFIFTVF
jgi:Family of unknown function (DUF5989)